MTPRFSTNRAVCEYTEQHYLPAAEAYRERAANKGASGVALVNRRRDLAQKRSALRFGTVNVESAGERHVIEVQLHLDELDLAAVQVELFANGLNGGAAQRVEMQRVRQRVGATNGYAHRATVPATRYTARLIARGKRMAVPLDDTHILWQR